jgi:putative addiction module antidote
MTAVKVRRIGNSLGIILPKEELAKLNVGEGDQIFLSESPGGYRVTANDAEFELQMRLAKDVMREYRDTLRELAK